MAAAGASAGALAADWLDRFSQRFEQATETVGLIEDDLEVAGVPLRLQFAGEAMREVLLPPFAHLRATASPAAPEPDLRIAVFDSASTGVEAPEPAWERLDADPGTNPMTLLQGEGVFVLASAGTGAVTGAAPGQGQAVFYLPDARRVSPIERAAPLREAMQLLMAARGRWMTHAGGVGLEGKGVLLVGRGGSGKSTLSLACARAGMEIVADDYVLLETNPARAHAMQSTAKLTQDGVERLGLEGDAIPGASFEPTLEGTPKALIEVETLAPGRLRRDLDLAALVAPRIAGVPTPRLEQVTPARGLQALAPSTVFQSGVQGRETFAALGRLVRSLPCFELRLSSDSNADAAAVAGLVERLA